MRALFGTASGTNLVVALLIGSLVNLAAFVVVNSTVADYLERDAHGIDGAVESFKRVLARRRDIGGAFGARVRDRLPAADQHDRLPDRGVPARSLPVHRPNGHARGSRRAPRAAPQRTPRQPPLAAHRRRVGRRQRTGDRVRRGSRAAVLLLLVPGLPLWAFSALAAVVYAVLVPLAAISMTLLYGDAVAEQEVCRAADLVQHDDDRRSSLPIPPRTSSEPGDGAHAVFEQPAEVGVEVVLGRALELLVDLVLGRGRR